MTSFLRVGVNTTDVTDITVENFFVVVVVGLHHLVTDAIGEAKTFDEDLVNGRVQSFLEVDIQRPRTKTTTIHRAQHPGCP